MYLPRQRLAVASLQPVAVVDKKTFPHPHVFVHFDVPHASASEFRRRIGEAEDELGISLAHRVPITEYAAINNVELTIGVINALVVALLLVRRYGPPGFIRALHSGRSLSK
ncbi:hypothetical protein AAVH_42952 [Aphelenchoides avenae]|nr:hypothetical protein AAVH_42952 [Aphelenchus avenae]